VLSLLFWLQTVATEPGFEKQGAPRPGEWRSVFHEDGQTFAQYVRDCENRKSEQRHTIYLQPLGDAGVRYARTLLQVRDYASAFFGIPARIAKPLPIDQRTFAAARKQFDASALIRGLKSKAPDDALVFVALTDRDLFAPGLNFLFGQGDFANRTGVSSLVRYQTPDAKTFLRRTLKLVTHEAGHILSLRHCTFYRCVMQGANTLAEDDSHPMHLCSIDLRKLEWNLKFDPRQRYEHLRKFYGDAGLTDEAAWVDQQLARYATSH
jgi:archaemetzincin